MTFRSQSPNANSYMGVVSLNQLALNVCLGKEPWLIRNSTSNLLGLAWKEMDDEALTLVYSIVIIHFLGNYLSPGLCIRSMWLLTSHRLRHLGILVSLMMHSAHCALHLRILALTQKMIFFWTGAIVMGLTSSVVTLPNGVDHELGPKWLQNIWVKYTVSSFKVLIPTLQHHELNSC